MLVVGVEFIRVDCLGGLLAGMKEGPLVDPSPRFNLRDFRRLILFAVGVVLEVVEVPLYGLKVRKGMSYPVNSA
ncbi:MAG: hypothetical protein WKF67_15030 [Rubrobacteraceae bacterium]